VVVDIIEMILLQEHQHRTLKLSKEHYPKNGTEDLPKKIEETLTLEMKSREERLILENKVRLAFNFNISNTISK
jgi:hypothetical protein